MIEIYTPQAWLSFFGGSASLFIDDDGYIYTKEEHYKLLGGSPCGWISYESGFIYGSDYNALWPTPIAELVKNDDVVEVYEYGGGVFRSPILYIKNKKIYTPEEYLRIFGGSPSGYIRDTESSNEGSSNKAPAGNGSSGGGGDVPVLGIIIGIVALGALVVGLWESFL